MDGYAITTYQSVAFLTIRDDNDAVSVENVIGMCTYPLTRYATP